MLRRARSPPSTDLHWFEIRLRASGRTRGASPAWRASSAAHDHAQSVCGPLAATDIHGEPVALDRVAACSIQDSLASTDRLLSRFRCHPSITLPRRSLNPVMSRSRLGGNDGVRRPYRARSDGRLQDSSGGDSEADAIWCRTHACARGSWRVRTHFCASDLIARDGMLASEQTCS